MATDVVANIVGPHRRLTVKKELFYIGAAIYWLILVGFVAPWLVSAESTIAVIIGFALLIGSAYATYRIIRKEVNK